MAVDLSKIEPSAEAAHEYFPPTDIGPIHALDDDGYYVLPEHTIGWDCVAWAETKLAALRGDGKLQLTNEQRRILLWFYAVDLSGKFIFRRAVLQAFKGWGKDPLLAIICLIEFVGPSRFSHFEDGRAVGKRNKDAWVQLAGVSADQLKNTSTLFPRLVTRELIQDHNLDVQKTLIYAYGGVNRLEVIGSSHRSAEGNRATFVCFNEIQHFTTGNGGHDLYRIIRGNLTKTGGRFIAISNAYEPGEGSVLQDIREAEEAIWSGLVKGPREGGKSDTLYMSREAHPDAPMTREWAPFIMDTIIGEAFWVRENMDEILQDMMDASYGILKSRRYFYNQITTGESAFFSVGEWDGSLAEGVTGDEADDLKPGDEIVLGFDGSKTDDATALIAIRIKDKLIVPILIEQRPHGPRGEYWRVNEALVHESVQRAFATYKVKAFYADVHLWESYIQQWVALYGELLEVRASADSSIGWDMRGSEEKISRAWERYRDAIINGDLKHNGHKLLRAHALNAHLGHNRKGIIARKESRQSNRKIDAMVASYVAYTALSDLLEKGVRGRKRHKPSRILRGSY